MQVALDEIQTEESEGLVRLRLITHNARLVDARKQHGMTQPEMARATGLPWYRVHLIETMKVVPREDEMVKIACVLEKPIDYLFPEHLLSAIEAGVFSRRKVELPERDILFLTEHRQRCLLSDGGIEAVEEELDKQLLAEEIAGVLETLKPREQRVLKLRFGLEDGISRTLKEVGNDFGVTGAAIHVIEAQALRKLRHPRRSRKLKDYLD